MLSERTTLAPISIAIATATAAAATPVAAAIAARAIITVAFVAAAWGALSPAGAFTPLGSHFVWQAQLFKGPFAAELDAVVLIDVDHEHFHLVTHATNVAHRADIAGR